MADLPQLIAATPEIIPSRPEEEVITIIPAEEEKIYNKLWMTQLSIISKSPTEEAKVVAVFKPARDIIVNVDGEDTTIKELMPDGESISIVIFDLFKRMDEKPSLAMAMGAVLTELIAIGQEKGIIA